MSSPYLHTKCLFESLLKMWDSSLAATAATEKLVLKMMVKDKKQKLNDRWQQILKRLEPSVNIQDVEKELVMLYHNLSKEIHYPPVTEKGIWCGGRLPLRAAVALAILMLQNEMFLIRKFEVKYCDENGKHLATLYDGGVMRYFGDMENTLKE